VRLRDMTRYQRALAWIFGVMLFLMALWLVLLAIAVATGRIE
jgi:hypothetical protein